MCASRGFTVNAFVSFQCSLFSPRILLLPCSTCWVRYLYLLSGDRAWLSRDTFATWIRSTDSRRSLWKYSSLWDQLDFTLLHFISTLINNTATAKSQTLFCTIYLISLQWKTNKQKTNTICNLKVSISGNDWYNLIPELQKHFHSLLEFLSNRIHLVQWHGFEVLVQLRKNFAIKLVNDRNPWGSCLGGAGYQVLPFQSPWKVVKMFLNLPLVVTSWPEQGGGTKVFWSDAI